MEQPEAKVVIAGKYRVESLLARGACGTVYVGEHTELGKKVAIKLIAEELARVEEATLRFRQEARAAAAVQSDHIVQVFDVGSDARFGLYMVMELLDGEDLEVRLRREKKLDVRTAVDVATQAARGLAKAHAAGIVHRDLKPANVFLGTRDDGALLVKLVDFGISKLLRDESAPFGGAKTRRGTAVGTPQYMSPEQAQGLAVDHRTDVWALGAVLFEMLAGRPAYHELETYEQTIIAIVRDETPSLAEFAPWVPASVVDVVTRALEHDVEARIGDATTFAQLLSDALATDPPLIELGPASSSDAVAVVEAVEEEAPRSAPTQTSATRDVVAVGPARSKASNVVRNLVAFFAIIGVLVVGGAVLGRHGETETASAPPAPVAPSASESASASASASVKAKPKLTAHPIKPKPKTSASASSKVSPSASKSFGAAGLASTY